MKVAPLRTVDMHTGGEPVRIVVEGYPQIPGPTILAKRRYAAEHLDHLRRLLMFEPRGHADMYGVIPVTPDHPEADLAVLFMHNEGYSTMCGHATIAVGRWAIEHGIVPMREPVTTLALQVPAGLVRVSAAVAGGRVGRVGFRSVPAFVEHSRVPVAVPGFGEITVDVAYGGAFYAFADAADYGLEVPGSPIADLVRAAWATTGAAAAALALSHPDDPDLNFLYGTILTDGDDKWSERATANVCVFADRQVDRSPTGSGVTARIAIQRAAGNIPMGVERRFASVVGSIFTGEAVEETTVGHRPAVIVEVGGESHYTGESTFTVEDGDPLPAFLVR
ncbi:MAG TPA: proline racemase family protein [Acidimicrobiia bacterium]|nr:proline racemase family protein [Acidimicrobiia bacterium]